MNVSSIDPTDLDSVIKIYYEIETKTPSCTLDGWTLGEVREQLSGFINSDNYICLCSKDKQGIAAFVFCRVASARLATIEIFCKNLNHAPAGVAGCGWEVLLTELFSRLKQKGVQSANTLVNKKYHNFRVHTRLLEFGGFSKISEFAEYEIDL